MSEVMSSMNPDRATRDWGRSQSCDPVGDEAGCLGQGLALVGAAVVMVGPLDDGVVLPCVGDSGVDVVGVAHRASVIGAVADDECRDRDASRGRHTVGPGPVQ